MAHAFVTVVVPFDRRNADAVDTHLNGLGNLAKPVLSKKLKTSAFVHFMSLIVVRGSSDGRAHLVLEASADGYPDGVLRRLANEIGDELLGVLAVAKVPVPQSELGEFLVRHDRQVGQGWFAVPGVVFTGTPGMTVGRIRQEAELSSRIQAILDTSPPQGSALATLKRLRAQLFGEGVYKWAFVAEPVLLLADAQKGLGFVRPVLWSALRTFLWPLFVLPLLVLLWQGLVPLVLLWQGPVWQGLVLLWHGLVHGLVLLWHWLVQGLVLLWHGLAWQGLVWQGLGLALQGIWRALVVLGIELLLVASAGWIAYKVLQHKENTDAPDDSAPSAKALGEIMALENQNQCMQNHLVTISTMKSGGLRRLTLRLALWAIGALAEYHARPGFLSNIGTIHFARWILLPGTDKLLLLSNYTGSWESYLEDFILELHYGLTGVWSNTQGFPRTTNLVQGGAQHGDRLKRWARRQQQPTRFWYAAYPELTAARVRTNAAIRDGFANASTERDAARWLVHFRFVPPENPENPPLKSDLIPALVFAGLPGLQCARSLVLRLSDEPAKARAWLAAIEQDIGYGEEKPVRSTLVLGLSKSGLQKLGLDGHTRSTFSVAFQHGMAAQWRARALGDVGDNDPKGWCWGGPGNEADAILNLYAPSEEHLQEQTDHRTAQFREFGIQIIYQILLDKMPPKNTPIGEPFGFTDGVSQPIIQGARKWVVARNQIHVVEPGEMILGYKDNLGDIPSSPSTADGHDLGCNGTYLVVRQLEQKNTDFFEYVADEAKRLRDDDDPRVPKVDPKRLADWIGAKMLGRWQDGTSLVRHPNQPGSASSPGTLPDNDFLFGTEDPDGLRCPFGAHIRRVNPRESFDPGSEGQLKVSNRHRIFRVGRRYAPQNGLKNPGLLFMCVNANIERQFEFVQQTWMRGSSFHGLENEIDSLARHPRPSDVLTIPTESDVLTIPTENGPLRLKGIGSFVTVRGGGYFFMPGRDALRFLIGNR